MSTEAKLVVEPRQVQGTAACRRLRQQGFVPGNVYGHQSKATPVVVAADVLRPIVKAGTKVVDLDFGGQKDKALLREVQYDAFGIEITHFDLMRVDPNERVTIHVPLVLKGTAPGTMSGGMLEQPLHSLTIDCLTYQIPDSIPVRVGTLEIGQYIHVKDLEIPADVHVQNSPDAVVVHCVQVQTKDLPGTEAAAGAAEPEVIGKKPADAAAATDDKKDAGKKK